MRIARLLFCLAFATAAPAPAGAARSPCRPQPASAVPPPLTSTECISASRIFAHDATLHRLLAGLRYSVGRPDPWGGGDGVHNIGAVLKVRLAVPLNVARIVLPVASFSDDGSTYTPGRNAVSIHGARSLDVFVDLSRRRVVWIIPFPAGSEGPPPTSIPPYTAPPGFVSGTGGATVDDAERGLVLHLVTFDDTGRLQQEEWADPLRGQAVTDLYNPERRLMVSFVGTFDGRKLTVTTIDYLHHTWTTGSGPVAASASATLPLDSRTVPARLRSEVTSNALTPEGQDHVGGLEASRFRGAVGLIYFGLSLGPAGTGELWLDPDTYLPIQQTIESGRTHAVEQKTLFSWLPRTAGTGRSRSRCRRATSGPRRAACRTSSATD